MTTETTDQTNPTPANLARIDAWMQRLAEETDQAAHSAELTRYLTVLSRFYTYNRTPEEADPALDVGPPSCPVRRRAPLRAGLSSLVTPSGWCPYM